MPELNPHGPVRADYRRLEDPRGRAGGGFGGGGGGFGGGGGRRDVIVRNLHLDTDYTAVGEYFER